MTRAAGTLIDVERVRADHPIEDVVTAAGVDLTPRGRGFMGCCPFHDDDTASMSVGGVPERFHCFGCDATGDVIDFTRRLYGLSFREAVEHLDQGAVVSASPVRPTKRLQVGRRPEARPVPGRDRAHEVNAVAWRHFSTPVATEFAHHYLHHHRGIDLQALRAEFPNVPLVGSAGHAWTGLVDHLRAQGVSDEEILAMDLGMRTRHGSIVDTLRDRIIIPVTNPAGTIDGFIGRDTSGDPRAPKYRNPTRTSTFDKRTVLYRPTHHQVGADAAVIVVEGPLDALSIAAAAARTGQSAALVPCTASGVAVSDAQAAAVTRLSAGQVEIALDADRAGAEGTLRWIAALAMDHHRAASVTRLPDGLDPADWLARTGDPGLDAFHHTPTRSLVAPRQAGRELVQLSLSHARDPVRDTVACLLPLACQLKPVAAAELLRQAEDEMTRSGWNPHEVFSRCLREEAVGRLRHGLGPQGHTAATSDAFRAQELSPVLSRP
jgi:DNA primase